jgi:hypothetical protein
MPLASTVAEAFDGMFEYHGFGVNRVSGTWAWGKHVGSAAPFSGLKVEASVEAEGAVVEVVGFAWGKVGVIIAVSVTGTVGGVEGWGVHGADVAWLVLGRSGQVSM